MPENMKIKITIKTSWGILYIYIYVYAWAPQTLKCAQSRRTITDISPTVPSNRYALWCIWRQTSRISMFTHFVKECSWNKLKILYEKSCTIQTDINSKHFRRYTTQGSIWLGDFTSYQLRTSTGSVPEELSYTHNINNGQNTDTPAHPVFDSLPFSRILSNPCILTSYSNPDWLKLWCNH